MEVSVLRGEVPKGKGSGYGSGSGYGYGSGYGDGSGYGSGSGSAGSGSGDGYGDGYGSGSAGSGDGSGDGDGYGYGSGSYWSLTIDCFAGKWSPEQQTRLCDLRSSGAQIAFWRSRNDGTAANGGKNAPVKPGTVEKSAGPLRDECGARQLHATLIPTKWEGERWWVVALLGEVRGDDEKYWALEREIIGEAL